MKQKRILCIGNSVLDQIYNVENLPVTPGKYFAKSFLEAGGGPAATGAVAVARLGQRVELWSRVGDDPAGQRIMAELANYGVDTSGMYRAPNCISPIATVLVDATGERLIVGFVDPQFPVDAHWLDLNAVAAFDCVLGDMRWTAGVAKVFQTAALRGVPTVLDADMCPKTEDLHTLAALAGHVVFSEGGLRQYSGEGDPEAGLRHVAERIKGIPYVTLGEKGCLWLDGGSLRHVPSFKVPVVDTTGAGDVFHGAFALALAEGLYGDAALRFAAGAAALKCSKPGGRAGIPDRATLEKFLAEN